MISVAAVNGAGQRATFSDRNSSVELSAPGISLIGAGPNGHYLQASGTSPASAFVAGVAALIRSAYPRLSPAQVAQALLGSARHRPTGGYSPSTGFGELDAVTALHAAGRLAAARQPPGWPRAATWPRPHPSRSRSPTVPRRGSRCWPGWRRRAGRVIIALLMLIRADRAHGAGPAADAAGPAGAAGQFGARRRGGRARLG